MKKDVWIAISSKQMFIDWEQAEEMDLVTAATMYERNGKYFIAYDESELTGLEGTHTTMKLDGKTVTLTRSGSFPSRMLFSEAERHVGVYKGPEGLDMTITTSTSQVRNSVGENGGALVLDYTTEIMGAPMGEHHLEMVVSVKPGKESQNQELL